MMTVFFSSIRYYGVSYLLAFQQYSSLRFVALRLYILLRLLYPIIDVYLLR